MTKKIDRGVEALIKQAMETGIFDNLPGMGKPFNFEEYPNTDSEWRLAFDMLKKAGFAPIWLETRQEIEKEYSEAIKRIKNAYHSYAIGAHNQKEQDAITQKWQRARDHFSVSMEKLNRRIRDYNLQIPAPVFYRNTIDIDAEICRIMTGKSEQNNREVNGETDT